MSQVTFKGNIANTILKEGNASLGQKVMAWSLAGKESKQPFLPFLQDTCVALVPKLLVSRSPLEGGEAFIVEGIESGLVYFLMPRFGGPLFQNLFKHKTLDKALLAKPFNAIKDAAHTNHQVLAAKAATIISTIAALGLVGESISNYGKNLFTAHFFQKDKFSDVVNLSHEQMKTPTEQSPMVQKSIRRLKEVGLAFGSVVLGSFAFARLGPALFRNMKPVENLVRKFVEKFDFRYTEPKSGSKSGAVFALSNPMLGATMLLSMIPYLDSARDKYERRETLFRLPIVFAYILFGQPLLEKLLVAVTPTKDFKSILKNSSQEGEKKEVAALEDLAQQALNKAVGQTTTLEKVSNRNDKNEIFKKAAAELQPILRTKSFHAGVPLLVGILGTGIGLGFLNRYMTQIRYTKQNPNPPVIPPFAAFSAPPPFFAAARQSNPMPMHPLPLSPSPFGQTFPTQAVYSTVPALKLPSPQSSYFQ